MPLCMYVIFICIYKTHIVCLDRSPFVQNSVRAALQAVEEGTIEVRYNEAIYVRTILQMYALLY